MTHRSTTINVIAQNGWTGMNTKLVSAWMLTKMMPSQRAQAAPEITPNPAAITMQPTSSSHQPQVDALVLTQ